VSINNDVYTRHILYYNIYILYYYPRRRVFVTAIITHTSFPYIGTSFIGAHTHTLSSVLIKNTQYTPEGTRRRGNFERWRYNI